MFEMVAPFLFIYFLQSPYLKKKLIKRMCFPAGFQFACIHSSKVQLGPFYSMLHSVAQQPIQTIVSPTILALVHIFLYRVVSSGQADRHNPHCLINNSSQPIVNIF